MVGAACPAAAPFRARLPVSACIAAGSLDLWQKGMSTDCGGRRVRLCLHWCVGDGTFCILLRGNLIAIC